MDGASAWRRRAVSIVVQFWAELGAEHKIKFMMELNKYKANTDGNYYRLLLGGMQKKEEWKTKIFPEVKSIVNG